MESENLLNSKEFIQKVFICDVERLISAELYHFAFVIMAQGLEVLGSFLDEKPLKAKDQSKLRFSHAINRLMPREYAKLNDNHRLYDQLRASLAHTFTSGRHVFLTSKSNKEFGNKHLENMNDQLILVAEDFYIDFKKACNRLLEGMEKGIISDKKINTGFYYTFN